MSKNKKVHYVHGGNTCDSRGSGSLEVRKVTCNKCKAWITDHFDHPVPVEHTAQTDSTLGPDSDNQCQQ